jgi:riboflavin kinase
MHEFQSDFYGHDMIAVVLGYIRPELDYTSRGNLPISYTQALLTSP